MAAADFPNSPTNGDTYTVNGVTWVYSSTSTRWLRQQNSAISKSLITAKGDLIAGAGVGAVTKVAVGTNGFVLKADSTATGGVSWVSVPTISSLSSVPGVTITSVATNDSLRWNGTAWVNDAGVYTQSTLVQNPQTASYPLVLADKGKLVEMNVASGNTLTVPLNSAQAFAIGSVVHILQTGAGQTTVTPASGVTINGTPGLKLRTQWSYATLIKRATDTWVLVGDIAA
jgi:hypothetical protein